MVKVTVSKLAKPYQHGDYKDPRAQWTVQGPGNERQDFARKVDASRYATIRRHSADAREAGKKYVSSSL